MLHRLLVAILAVLMSIAPAQTHPHIFVDAQATVVFDNTGAVVGLRHRWTFDEAFSAWSVQGLDTNGDGITSVEEMQDLADRDMEGLREYGYYTFAGEGSETLAFANGFNQRRTYEDGRTTLSFDIAFEEPYDIREALEIGVSDAEYYVAITFADASAVTLENAPEGCTARLDPPEELPPELLDQLYALPPEVTVLPPELAAAVRGMAGAIVVTCPDGAVPAATALDAANAMAEAQPQRVAAQAAPFGGPPPEPGFTLPQTGFPGWIAQLQRDFYTGLQGALGRLKADGNAFWILGGLSFLYGVFHAAGPGHGKVVISSYVLANEHQVRRGIALSFVAAGIQALVAIGFVLVAAAALQLSSLAMDAAVGWIGTVSYGLVALLGLWLIVRRVFNLGHRHELAGGHAHGHGHDHGHAHHRDHDHEHHEGHAHHVVTPDQIRGDWREQLAVVAGVGLRPCSGALVVLVFALSQGLLAAGIAATLLMALGTGITVAVLASLAVSAKGLALRFAGAGGGAVARAALWWLELAGALVVFGFGLALLTASLPV